MLNDYEVPLCISVMYDFHVLLVRTTETVPQQSTHVSGNTHSLVV